MRHYKVQKDDVISAFKAYYRQLGGGIDGYYERTILDGDIYAISEQSVIAYFSIYQSRGLTSLYVLDQEQSRYSEIFSYVLSLSLFENMLFTENDELFINQLNERNIPFQIQAYNFEANQNITTDFTMTTVQKDDIETIASHFGEFIEYNNMDLTTIDSFYYQLDDQVVCFGALEPLTLNPNRYSISMIVDEAFRQQGYGVQTVQFLTQYLQQHGKEVNARCYVKNDVSKNTLLKSGLVLSNRLFKVEN